ncbi:heterokaryon incompatibility protein-domain-containing protein [Phaeosphaeria sp. MPI-PUGE-AT-0046c]|nr:heterokaryon incompatibility protein-domain-containing protein [Phaeosphaeria sp. MPI-PUGE-AT-0046c]
MLKIYCNDGVHISASWIYPGHPSSPASAEYSSDTFPVFAATLNDSSTSGVIIANPLNLTPGSHESFSTIRRWIRQCERHSCCKDSHNWQHPTRLIDVGGKDSKNVRLYTTNPESPVKYAALSYCWGGDQKSKTVSLRLDERCKGFPLAELPKTIQDAIVTARRLKIPFLWADAICIVQDDPADKVRELAIMDQIYSGALITIAAARATTANDGFLQQRNLRECYGTVCRVRYRERAEGEKLSAFLAEKPLHMTYEDPIDSRGWIFQERFRAFRTLRFGITQTIWECPYGSKVDGGDHYAEIPSFSTPEYSESKFTGTPTDQHYPYALGDPNHVLKLEEALGTWQYMVQEYSERTLTESTDRLPAFAALAKAFGTYLRRGPEEYLAGLWAFDICMQLRWRRPSYVPKSPWCNKRYGPTWSWASLRGAVSYSHPRLLMGTDTLEVDLNECQIGWKAPDFKYGEVLFGKLKVKGFLRQLRWTNGIVIGWHHGEQRDVLLPLEAQWDCHEERDPEVWCLEINTMTTEHYMGSVGILLAKTVDNVYKRVGYFEFDHKEFEPEPIQEGLRRLGLPRNSNWFYNGGFQDIYIE